LEMIISLAMRRDMPQSMIVLHDMRACALLEQVRDLVEPERKAAGSHGTSLPLTNSCGNHSERGARLIAKTSR
jgi:hypothetical protein